ncbi:hypothetical protein KIW84_076526 [Lathyrus oleraceus]|uniref:Uncharacterized protein n=1 Tax=Pisum sativum TaxID=3888 RepID=A0A9D5A188_PEA|nr:hypothetical protein KIW84_076526 [Pisum sativum]
MVHTKKRNRLKQKTMNDLVYVMEENVGGNHVNVTDLDEDLMQSTGAKSTRHVDEFDVLETIESDNEEGNVDEGDEGDDEGDDYGGGDDEINEDEGVDIFVICTNLYGFDVFLVKSYYFGYDLMFYDFVIPSRSYKIN